MINFDEVIDRRGSHCGKWDAMESLYGVSPDDGIAMWVADTEFKPPQAVTDVLQNMVDHGIHGYFGDSARYKEAIRSWMQRHHDWSIQPEWIFTTTGLVSAIALALHAFSKENDGIIIFTPVYHEFASIITKNRRRVVASELVQNQGRYEMDLDALEASMDGSETMLVLCSPHNPGGRVWTKEELQDLASFCAKHDLILVADEVHQDLVYAPNTHITMSNAAPDLENRLVTLVAASKTFNIAGSKNGCAVIADEVLRERFKAIHSALGGSPNRFGMMMTEAAYNHGDEWLTAMRAYLIANKETFDKGVNLIPGVKSMSLESTFLAWVDFSGTGMEMDEVIRRVQGDAKIAANHGSTFGEGGENFLRFNLGCRREMVEDAVNRLQVAFADLQ